MSNIIPPMVSSSPPPMDDNIDDDEDDEFGDFASANLSYDIGGEDDEEDENYVEYGTPLEPLDEGDPVRKKPFTPVAKDSHGRRRFHGAFTGGFSAGFFNTVGSLEGWTPSSFKSSRSERAGSKIQKPEDFMDDEDVGEFGIAPSVLRARSDFSDERQKRKRGVVNPSDGPIPGKPVLEDLLRPVRETVGIRLLRKMGWKPGQGVGPRLSRAEKKRNKQEQKKTTGRVYGCSLPPGDEARSSDSGSSDEEYIANLTFAPDNCEQVLCKLKEDQFGIGYQGLSKKPVLSGHINLFEPSSLVMYEKNKKVAISGQAFGVGVLKNDDEDIYAQEDMTQYDFSLDGPSSSYKPKETSRFSQNNGIGQVLEGFVRGCTISSNKRFFPAPDLPVEFEPLHHVQKTRFGPELKVSENKQPTTASVRAAMLNESSVVTEQCDQQEEKRRLAAEAKKITESLLPVLSQSSGQFKPFTSNPDKQKRYEQFMALVKLGQKQKLASLQPLNMTEWEKERERTEFEQAMKLFTPLTGPMSDRFVTAAQPDDTTNPLAPVEKLVDENTDKRNAAKMKMFGRLTREIVSWRPSSLLLKRFNIAETTQHNLSSHAPVRKPTCFSVFDYLDASALNKPKSLEKEKSSETTKEKEEESGMDVELVKLEPTEPEEISFPDPPEKIDLYKAIFLSSSEESEADENEKEEDDKRGPLDDGDNINVDPPPIRNQSPPPERNLSPPRGVFANLDLDAINVRKPVQPLVPPEKIPETKPTNSEVIECASSEEEPDMYGPKLPTQPLSATPTQTVRSVLPSAVVVPHCEWVEKHKKHKSKHHKKEHKKSSKHKSKKSKRKR